MYEIDLGEDVKFKVKFRGVEYILKEPTVSQIELLKSSEESGSADMAEFLGQLGFDKALVAGMGMSKVKQLVESMLEMVTKKK